MMQLSKASPLQPLGARPPCQPIVNRLTRTLAPSHRRNKEVEVH